MKVRKINLNEETLDQAVDAAEKQIDNAKIAKTASQITMELDRALSVARRNKRTGGKNYTNVLLVGTAGTGKTSTTMQWAKNNGINLVLVNTSTLDETDLTGVVARSAEGNSTVKLKSDVLRALNEPNSVLFLDEYNRGRSSVRGTLLTLVNDHLIDTGTDEKSNVPGLSGKMELKNMLFTIAAINPASGEYQTDELDPAEISRFKRVNISTSKKNWLEWFTIELNRQISTLDPDNEQDAQDIEALEGQLSLAKKIISDELFQFDTEEDEREGYQKYGRDYTPLTFRTLTNLLQATDGTKGDFLDMYSDYCNPAKKPVMEHILADYDDIDDKANSVFKKREKSDEEKLQDFLQY